MIRIPDALPATPDPSSPPEPPSPPHRLEDLGDEIAELAAQIHAANYRLLVRLREFDALFEESGGLWGFKSAAHWLSWRTSIGPLAARERVRVARALGELPLLSAAMERGELSYSKVRALTRIEVEDRETEAELLEVARQATAAQVERLVRTWRRAARPDEEAEAERLRHERRGLTLFPDEDGSWVVRGRLDPEVGALLEKALDLAAERAKAKTAEVEREPLDRRRADAVGLLAEAALRHGTLTDETLNPVPAEPSGWSCERAKRARTASASSATRSVAETSKRLSCDAGRVVIVHDADGNVLDVGRRSRTVPAPIRRALEHRDRGCVFPACGSRFTDAHHIEHWSKGGETKLDNLVLLCRRHHRAVHEGGVRVERSGDGRVRFRRPDGRVIPTAPPLPPVFEEPLERLREAERAGGVEIDAWTAAPGAGAGAMLEGVSAATADASSGWGGDPFDLDLALGFFLDGPRHGGPDQPPSISARSSSQGAPSGSPTASSPGLRSEDLL